MAMLTKTVKIEQTTEVLCCDRCQTHKQPIVRYAFGVAKEEGADQQPLWSGDLCQTCVEVLVERLSGKVKNAHNAAMSLRKRQKNAAAKAEPQTLKAADVGPVPPLETLPAPKPDKQPKKPRVAKPAKQPALAM